MALIKCPECQQQISDKSKQCIHCGYPLEELKNEKTKLTGENIITIYPQKYNLENELELIMNGEEIQASKNIRDIIGLGVRNSHKLVSEIKRLGQIPNEFSFEKTTDIIKSPEILNNIPKCPTCGSSMITYISGAERVTGALTFGLFSKTAKSQFKCGNCGYKW